MNLLNWEEYNDEDQFLEDFGNPPEKPPTAEQVRALQVRSGAACRRVLGLRPPCRPSHPCRAGCGAADEGQ